MPVARDKCSRKTKHPIFASFIRLSRIILGLFLSIIRENSKPESNYQFVTRIIGQREPSKGDFHHR